MLKSVNDLTFKDVVSLVFHSLVILSKSKNEPNSKEWIQIYEEFEKELQTQNNQKWPQLNIIKNTVEKRIDIFTINGSFNKTTNLFMLLLRLLYFENYKRPYIYKSYNFHKILGYKIKNHYNTELKYLSIHSLYDILIQYLEYYSIIYYDNSIYESGISNEILKLLK